MQPVREEQKGDKTIVLKEEEMSRIILHKKSKLGPMVSKTSGYFSMCATRAPMVPGQSCTSSSKKKTYLLSLCMASTPAYQSFIQLSHTGLPQKHIHISILSDFEVDGEV